MSIECILDLNTECSSVILIIWCLFKACICSLCLCCSKRQLLSQSHWRPQRDQPQRSRARPFLVSDRHRMHTHFTLNRCPLMPFSHALYHAACLQWPVSFSAHVMRRSRHANHWTLVRSSCCLTAACSFTCKTCGHVEPLMDINVRWTHCHGHTDCAVMKCHRSWKCVWSISNSLTTSPD